MRIEFHFDRGGFAALKPEWNDLLHRSCCDTVFLTWQWQSAWWKHLGEGDLVLLGFRSDQDGRLVGLAPMFRCRAEDGRAILAMVGCRDVSDYLDLIVEVGQEEAVYAAFLDYLASDEAGEWDAVDLCNIPDASSTYEVLRRMADERGYGTVVEVEDVAPIIPLPDTWDEYLMLLDKKQRHEIRRKLRKAGAAGEAEFYIVGPEHDLKAEMDAFIELHQKSTPEKDAFMDPRMQGFFFEVAQTLQAEGWLQLAFVEVQGDKAASLLNFDYADTILVYNSGYDPVSYRNLSPGIVVTARCIETAIELGRKTFDFLRGDEEYKYRFGAQDTRVRRLLIARPGVSLDVVC
ncbi:MAG TPA: GNAT family N-acetyltransferase [Anaerolineae bacterium]|nr:GNAT family N-acetyltransferase [Anaerolineae bacterium]